MELVLLTFNTDGRSIDLELCGDRAKWKAVTRRPDPAQGLMMMMNTRNFIVSPFYYLAIFFFTNGYFSYTVYTFLIRVYI